MRWFLPLVALVVFTVTVQAQRGTGELRIQVRDPDGLPVAAHGTVTGDATAVALSFDTSADGRFVALNLPYGYYVLRLSRPGFSEFFRRLEVRSAMPLTVQARLQVARVRATVAVTDAATLLDPSQTGGANFAGSQSIRDHPAAAPGRAVLSLVGAQPGWIFEANGVLHPRGAEYDTQYVVDGVPITDNRSPAFAPGFEVAEVQSMKILTAGYPAEYGGKLGGVIEIDSRRPEWPGLHFRTSLHAGSFGARAGYLSAEYLKGGTAASLAVDAAETDRFLDPPEIQNFSNHGSQSGASFRFERDLSSSDRVRGSIERHETGFLVPNEIVQQKAGQRQDRRNTETMGTAAYQRVFSPKLLGEAHMMVRQLGARLWSNAASTPIAASQDRGFRQLYLGASLAADSGRHDFKAGVETWLTSLHERFAYRIVDPGFFDAVPPRFQFQGRALDREHSAYVQDLVRAGPWTLSAGLRWDLYRLLVRDSAFSPRLGLSRYWPNAGLVLRASYDRVFEPPAIENLLLASSAAAQHLTRESTGLPVPPSRGNFFQLGFSKGVGRKLRLDGNWFLRRLHNFADDDVFLNTGVSFPIAFAAASISGFEAKLELPRWRRWSGYLSYSNLVGTGWLPVTGGLFLEAGSAALLTARGNFPVTQDQRNTASARLATWITNRLWVAAAGAYASGLPIQEADNADLSQYSPAILRRVNLARGRVRPSRTLDLAAGFDVWTRDRPSLRLQADAQNVTNRLNVIDFAGLFSGTALAPPRSFGVRLAAEF